MIIASRWLPHAAILITAGSVLWIARRTEAPPRPAPAVPIVNPAPLAKLLAAVPTRAMPCTDTTSLTLRALDGAPVLCGDDGCLQLDLDRHAAAFVDRVALSSTLPLHADVKRVDDHWAACGGDTCRPLGRRLSRALDASNGTAEATLDRRAVVIDDVIWNVDADRIVKLRRPEILPNGPEHQVTVIGDLLNVQWQGGCTDGMCLVTHLVDRNGREIDWIQPHGAVLRIDDRFFMAISEFSVIEIRDLHSGKLASRLDPRLTDAPSLEVTRLDSRTFALLRGFGGGVRVSKLAVDDGDVMQVDDNGMIVYDCDQ